ncbi:MAG: hypothetical protein ACFCUQ_06775 [Kiloniellales bacterium]
MGRLLRVAVLIPLLLVACGDPSKSDLIGKAKGADTKAKLEAALGAPDDLTKLGPLEKWTYKASDGEVTFLITGDSVTLELAGGSQN